ITCCTLAACSWKGGRAAGGWVFTKKCSLALGVMEPDADPAIFVEERRLSRVGTTGTLPATMWACCNAATSTPLRRFMVPPRLKSSIGTDVIACRIRGLVIANRRFESPRIRPWVVSGGTKAPPCTLLMFVMFVILVTLVMLVT